MGKEASSDVPINRLFKIWALTNPGLISAA
jgi:hypothetical protein